VGWYESIVWIVRMTETCDFIEVRCRQTGALLGVMDNAAVPSEFLRGAPFCRLGATEGREGIHVARVILVERMTFEWREPRLAPPYTATGTGRLLLTFMMVGEEDIAYLECVVGFRKAASWEDVHGHGRALQ